MLVNMQTITEVIETIIFTAYVDAPSLCSVILVGPSGSGKSQVMMQFRRFPSVSIQNDLTTMKMAEILDNDRENKIRHFLIPDLNPSLSHKPAVVALFLSSLLTLQSEGVFSAENVSAKRVEHAPVGIITGCTPEMYEYYHKRLRVLGLIRRNAPIFYTLSLNTIEQAQREKRNGVIHVGDDLKPNGLASKRVDIPPHYAELVQAHADTFTEYLSTGPVWQVDPTGKRFCRPGKVENLLPLAPHDFLRTVTKAHALRAHRTTVNQEDLDFSRRFVALTKYGEARQI